MGPLEIQWGKVVTNIGALIAGIILIIKGEVALGSNMVTGVLLYSYGNGRLVTKGEAPSNMIQTPQPPTNGKTGHIINAPTPPEETKP